jgi:hypothetical protein
MIISPVAQTKIEDYLNDFAVRLPPLSPEQTRDLVEEIRSHILEAATTDPGCITEASADAALARLGSPSELATGYVDVASSPFLIEENERGPRFQPRESFFSQALQHVPTAAVVLATLLAYLAAGILVLSALSKPFHPARVGLWKAGSDDFSLHLGLASSAAAPAGNEILGWSIIPLGLIAAVILVTLAVKIDLRLLRLCRQSGIHIVA